MHKLYIFTRIKQIKIKSVPTLPKIFRPITRNTHFFIWPYMEFHMNSSKNIIISLSFYQTCFGCVQATSHRDISFTQQTYVRLDS